MKKRILFSAAYSSIEPLGLLHLSGLARDCGWERKIHLVKGHDFTTLFECINCYNSSSAEDIKVTPELAQKIADAMGKSGRLFPYNVRNVDDVVAEGEEILQNWPTEVIAFVDDVHGFDTKSWMPELASKWPSRVGIGYHAQMRWEMVNGDGGKRRLDLMKSAGGFALTLAIESANDHVRREVLDRATPEKLMFDGMKEIRARGMKVRTEQITALPYGATSQRTPVNLQADLELVKLNVNLKPDMAWASTFAPYAGTKLGQYAVRHGHYDGSNNDDVPDSFFDRSVLRFPSEWVGLTLNKDSDAWLSGDKLELYRDQNAALRRHFNLLCLLPSGHVVAEAFLNSGDLSAKSLVSVMRNHFGLRDDCHWSDTYFSFLPESDSIKKRHSDYLLKSSSPDRALTDAVRHHLYDEVLYKK